MNKTAFIVAPLRKDIYLALEPTSSELDENNTPWLNLPFNGQNLPYFHRTSLWSGAATIASLLSNFGWEVSTINHSISFKSGELAYNPDFTCPEYHYFLSLDQNLVHLNPQNPSELSWQSPKSPVGWLIIDTPPTKNLLNGLQTYLSLSPQTKIAAIIHQVNQFTSDLLRLSNIILCPENLKAQAYPFASDADFFYFSRHSLKSKDQIVHFQKTHLLAEDTIASLLAGTIVAGRSLDWPLPRLLTAAKISLEHATLNQTPDLNHLLDLIKEAESNQKNLKLIAKSLVETPKGILAADESGGSIAKKFEKQNIPDDAKHRRDYRNIFFTTPNLSKYLNGIILFEETAYQKADTGQNFVDFLAQKGLIPGIKVDLGLATFGQEPEELCQASSTFPPLLVGQSVAKNETWTRGLKNLSTRLSTYYELGFRFAKWRAAFTIDHTLPSPSDPEPLVQNLKTPTLAAVKRNAEILSRYALLCQESNLVPILEPELVYDGDYSLEDSKATTAAILKTLFQTLKSYPVDLSACLLKVNMVMAGKQFKTQTSPNLVGLHTADVLKSAIPKNLAGVVFLSGGQTPNQATENLKHVLQNGPFPWPVTFSFARALQDPVLNTWDGDNLNILKAREAFKSRLIKTQSALLDNTSH